MTAPGPSRTSAVAVDLIDTLVEHGGPAFTTLAAQELVRLGCTITEAAFRRLFRERFLEYTMGNYDGDEEFLEVLAADLPAVERPSLLAPLVDLRIALSRPLPGADEFLRSVSARYRTVLATNYVGEWARRIVLANGWERHFHAVVVSSDVGCRKPARRFFQRVLEESGAAAPADVVFVGDSHVNDIYGAHRVGVRTIFIDRGGSVDELDRGVARGSVRGVRTASVSSLREALALL